jgi:flagellar protein FlbD
VIKLHKLNGTEIVLNAELIETLEVGAETVVSLATGNKVIVREGAEEVSAKVLEYKRKIHGEDAVVNPIKSFERKNV